MSNLESKPEISQEEQILPELETARVSGDSGEPVEAERNIPEPPPDSELASAIAQVIEASFQDEPLPVAEEEALEPPVEEEPLEISAEEPKETPAEEPGEAVPEPVSEPVSQPGPEGKESRPKAKKKRSRKEKEPVQPVNSAPRQKKIPTGRVHTGFLDALVLMLMDIRERRQEDLPDSQTSLNARENYYAGRVRRSGMFAPLRVLFILVMVLSIAGRRYAWMLLGILGGDTGIWIALIVTALSMAVSWESVRAAIRDIYYLRFSFESLLLFLTLVSMVEAVAQRNTGTLLPLLAISWCLAGMTDLMWSRGKLRSLRTVLTAKNRTGVRLAYRLYETQDCIGKAPAGVYGFARHQETGDTFHFGWSLYAVLLLLASMIVSAYLTGKTEGNYLTVFSTVLTSAMPFAALWCCARPYELLTRALGRRGALAGWFGIRMLSGTRSMLIYDSDLFPAGRITHKGVKVYGNQTPRLLISYGASLVLRANNGLTEPFTQLLREVDGQIHNVRYFQVSEGGVTGDIHGVHVAVGTYSFMQLIGAIPPSYAPKSGLFIALNGQIAGLFSLRHRVQSGAAAGFHRLVREPGLTLVAATKGFSVNPSFLMDWFQIPVGDMLCPKVDTRWKLAGARKMRRGAVCGYLGKDGIVAYSRMVAGARRTHRMGIVFTVLSVILSVAMLVHTAAILSGGVEAVTGTQLLLIQFLLLLLEELWARFSIR